MKTISANASNEEVSAAVAEAVAGWTNVAPLSAKFYAEIRGVPPGASTKHRCTVPPYATDANAVIALLEQWHVTANFCCTTDCWTVHLMGKFLSKVDVDGGPHETFARAGAFALLKAHGFEVTT